MSETASPREMVLGEDWLAAWRFALGCSHKEGTANGRCAWWLPGIEAAQAEVGRLEEERRR